MEEIMYTILLLFVTAIGGFTVVCGLIAIIVITVWLRIKIGDEGSLTQEDIEGYVGYAKRALLLAASGFIILTICGIITSNSAATFTCGAMVVSCLLMHRYNFYPTMDTSTRETKKQYDERIRTSQADDDDDWSPRTNAE